MNEPDAALESIDFSYLDQLRSLQREDGPNIAVSVIQIFLKNAPGHISTLRELARSADYVGAGRMAHKIKSTALNVGAKKLVSYLTLLEAASEADPRSIDWNAITGSVESEFAVVKNLLLPVMNADGQ